ncbi:complement C1q subcomponent subunit A-like [Rhinoraja longicauda]
MRGVGLLLLILMMPTVADAIKCVPDGQDGNPGAPGTAGRDGRPGTRGDTGNPGAASGTVDAPQKRGPPGDPGSAGNHGRKGHIGQVGLIGEDGPHGPQGQKGSSGQGGGLRGRERPAFSAVISSIPPPSYRKPIIFNRYITNEGNCFERASGKFLTCKAGWYYFTFNIATRGKLCINIMRNNIKEAGFCDVAATKSQRPNIQINSGGIVLRLKRQDQVWLETLPDYNNIYGSADVTSIFSGFLLFPDQ